MVGHRRGVVALDAGGTKISCALVLEDGVILSRNTIATSQESAESSIQQLVSLIEEAVQQCPRDVVAAGVGLIVPGWVNHRKHTVWAPNIAGWDHLPLRQKLEERIALPIVLDSDRCGYVKGEAWLGSARGLDDVVFLAVGTGIGAGIMAGGRVVHGHDDLAGAVGWFALNPEYRDAYRLMGCFEAEASGQSLGRKGSAATGRTVTARDVIMAAQEGRAWAVKIMDEVTIYLGMGIGNLVSALNPEMIVLGGGLFQSGPEILERVRREFSRWAQPFAAERVRIEPSSLGDRAGVLGAARIALDNI